MNLMNTEMKKENEPQRQKKCREKEMHCSSNVQTLVYAHKQRQIIWELTNMFVSVHCVCNEREISKQFNLTSSNLLGLLKT